MNFTMLMKTMTTVTVTVCPCGDCD